MIDPENLNEKGGNMVGNDPIHTVTRKEHDCIGYMDVPKDVYWGIHTQRALGNFTVSRIADSTHPQLMRAYAETVKRACAEANDELGLIDHDKARLIVAACRDVENGELADQFPVDVLQGGAGTSTNMNMNEVIANRALELGGHPKGDYGFIHPNDDVNHSQSTNDTYPAACKLALIDAIGPLAEETKKLTRAFHDLADKHTNDVTIGRTQLQACGADDLRSGIPRIRKLPEKRPPDPRTRRPATDHTEPRRHRHRHRHLRRPAVRARPPHAIWPPSPGCPSPRRRIPWRPSTGISGYIATVARPVKNLAVHLEKAADDLRLLNSGPHTGFDDLNVPAPAGGQQHHARQGEPGHPRMREPMLLHGVRHGHDRHMGRIRRAIAASTPSTR